MYESGDDIIRDYPNYHWTTNFDTLKLPENIALADLVFTKIGSYNVKITFANEEGSILVERQLYRDSSNDVNGIEAVETFTGDVLTKADIEALAKGLKTIDEFVKTNEGADLVVMPDGSNTFVPLVQSTDANLVDRTESNNTASTNNRPNNLLSDGNVDQITGLPASRSESITQEKDTLINNENNVLQSNIKADSFLTAADKVSGESNNLSYTNDTIVLGNQPFVTTDSTFFPNENGSETFSSIAEISQDFI